MGNSGAGGATVTASRHGTGITSLLKLEMHSLGSDGTEDDQVGAGGAEENPGTDQGEEIPDTDQDCEQEDTPYEYESDELEYPIVLWTVLIFGLGIAFGRCTVRR